MLARGTDKLTRQQIADEMTRLQMTGGLDELSDHARKPARCAATAGARDARCELSSGQYEQLQRQMATGFAGTAR